MSKLLRWAWGLLRWPFERAAEVSDHPAGAGLLGFIFGTMLAGLLCVLIYG